MVLCTRSSSENHEGQSLILSICKPLFYEQRSPSSVEDRLKERVERGRAREEGSEEECESTKWSLARERAAVYESAEWERRANVRGLHSLRYLICSCIFKI